MKRLVFLIIVCFTATCPAQKFRYLNPNLSFEVRVKDLVSRLTLEEKVSQMLNTTPAIDRLGIPAYDWWNECLHGVARTKFKTTSYPQAIGMAATFDTDAMNTMGDYTAEEGRAVNNESNRNNNHIRYVGLTYWTPNINIFRDPRWGRGQETYGEDPFLSGRLAVAFVTGMQGDDPHYYRVISTPKHFAVHSGPEPTRHFADIDVSKHDELDTYTPAFRAAIVEGHADSVMCAYNAINGQPACANEFLLQHTLRGAWHFQGYVLSDCDAVRNIFRDH